MKPNHSNSDIYGDIDSWSLKEAPERLKVNSDNLKDMLSICSLRLLSTRETADQLLQLVEKERQEAYKKGYIDGGLKK